LKITNEPTHVHRIRRKYFLVGGDAMELVTVEMK
jgi:hypothetical protein